MNMFKNNAKAYHLWNVTGSFGRMSADVVWEGDKAVAKNDKILINSEIIRYDDGICVRKGKVKNLSNEEVILNTISSKFSLDGGEYEVYSQYNGWQNESMGAWQSLVSSVSACSKSIRNAKNAVPFMVLWSQQINRGVAFHLNAYSAWEMRISKVYEDQEDSSVEIEMGILMRVSI